MVSHVRVPRVAQSYATFFATAGPRHAVSVVNESPAGPRVERVWLARFAFATRAADKKLSRAWA